MQRIILFNGTSPSKTHFSSSVVEKRERYIAWNIAQIIR